MLNKSNEQQLIDFDALILELQRVSPVLTPLDKLEYAMELMEEPIVHLSRDGAAMGKISSACAKEFTLAVSMLFAGMHHFRRAVQMAKESQ
jgi:hypothetical protein